MAEKYFIDVTYNFDSSKRRIASLSIFEALAERGLKFTSYLEDSEGGDLSVCAAVSSGDETTYHRPLATGVANMGGMASFKKRLDELVETP